MELPYEGTVPCPSYSWLAGSSTWGIRLARLVYFSQHFDCLSETESLFKGGRPEGATPPIRVAIGRTEVRLVVSLDTMPVRAIETPKVPPHGQSLDAPIAVEDLALHALRYRLESLATAAPLQ